MEEAEKLKGLVVEAQFLIHANDPSRTVAFNEEIAALCGKVEESSSIYSAAAEAGMSYGKGVAPHQERRDRTGLSPLRARRLQGKRAHARGKGIACSLDGDAAPHKRKRRGSASGNAFPAWKIRLTSKIILD